MHIIQGRVRDYEWGSPSAIPRMFGLPPADFPVAELWFGAHPAAPARIGVGARALAINPSDIRDRGHLFSPVSPDSEAGSAVDLRQYIAGDPQGVLGANLVSGGGDAELPFLLKVIAPAQPLSLQVHPSKAQAERGFAREEQAGIDRAAAHRAYRDANHKPELVYAISTFEALVGFRTPRRILGVLSGLNTPVTDRIAQQIRLSPNAHGVRSAFAGLLSVNERPDAEAVMRVVAACCARDPQVSPSPRADALVGKLAQHYPGDPGVVASLLLNPVTLKPGEAMFTPAGTVHAYVAGLGVEIMANSDNVLRAGMTPKHIDVPELLSVIETVAAPPIRIAPEALSPVQATYYAPVDDFELSIISLRNANKRVRLRGSGPRIVLCLEGATELWADSGEYGLLNTGQAIFVRADDGGLLARGAGRFVLAGVP
ncbi:mannose-6-phosphate isomerase, class I [Trueperella sp. LYQ143]|uniref:mannose-6-phosphate isomerase, class I n=1 Tax=unclassified Trueperella TaxID=2630174 RepID=UPI0039832C69